MNESAIAAAPIDPPHDPGANTIDPLPGEPGIPNVAERARPSMSKKGLLAVALLILSLVAVSALSIQRFAASGKTAGCRQTARRSAHGRRRQSHVGWT
ncbi:MAG: hypothetical protein V9G29_07460 [Burkholderiaceae bacterium]